MKLQQTALLLISGVLVFGCQAGSSQGGGEQITIASNLPGSGEPADQGVPLQHAIQLAIDQHPTVRGFRLGYLPLDDVVAGSESRQKGVQNTRRMIETTSVLGMVGPFSSNQAAAEIPVANAQSLVMVSPSNTFECLTQAVPYCVPQPDALRPTGRNNYFRIAAPDPLQGSAMAGYAIRTLKVRRAAVMTQLQEWAFGGRVADNFSTVLTRLGGEVVLRQDFEAATNDFTAFLSSARARGAQAIYVAAPSGTRICAARAQMKGIFGDDAYFLGIDGMLFEQCIRDAGGNANSQMYMTVSSVDPTQSTDPAVKRVVDAYRRAHPTPADIPPYTFAAYDCALILIDAISRAIETNGGKIPTRQQVVEAVAHGHVKGLTGTYSFDTAGDAISPLMSVYRVENGHWVLRQSIDAKPA